jgi:glycosyltransferase involved in cell wall biosynthesis
VKVLYVSTLSSTVNAFLVPHIRMLVEQGHQVDIACNFALDLHPELRELGCAIYQVEFERSPAKRANYFAYKKLKRLIQDGQYDLVHTHTPVASACARIACRNLDEVKVIYTAHGFHFYRGAPLANWLLYYPLERWLAKYTDILITINAEDYARARRSLRAGRVVYVPGVGIDLDRFTRANVDRAMKRQELGIPSDAFLILSVGELNKNKNHEIMIRAVAQLANSQIYYLICGEGPLKSHLRTVVTELGLEDRVTLLGHRVDVAELCTVSDVFAFPSHREGLSVGLMEGMASRLPVVCSRIRGNRDLVKHETGGFLLTPTDINGFANSIKLLSEDAELRMKMGRVNFRVVSQFSKRMVQQVMADIYDSIL